MHPLAICGIVLASIAILLLIVTFICYYITFYSPKRKELGPEEFSLPMGNIYLPHAEQMIAWMKESRKLPHEDASIVSRDGLTLRGKYYEYAPGAVIELMMHGYRGNSERDMCGGVQRCFSLGRSALVVDQRAGGRSDGHTITFGIKEHEDCLRWVDYLIDKFGKDVRIILTGISMGASTVLMAGGRDLPENVIGIIADCGYSSPKEIIQKVMRQLHLPVTLLYPFVRMGAQLFGGFDPEAYSCTEAMKTCTVPVFFTHGEDDNFVPHEMSVKNFDACTAPKKLLSVPKAGHGLCYIIDPEGYCQALREIEGEYKK